MYRPTVRYSNIYRDYVNSVYEATDLDRNQIIRMALFYAAHSEGYREMLKSHSDGETSIPLPEWTIEEHEYWKEQNPIPPVPDLDEKISEKIEFKNQGGIKFTLF